MGKSFALFISLCSCKASPEEEEEEEEEEATTLLKIKWGKEDNLRRRIKRGEPMATTVFFVPVLVRNRTPLLLLLWYCTVQRGGTHICVELEEEEKKSLSRAAIDEKKKRCSFVNRVPWEEKNNKRFGI